MCEIATDGSLSVRCVCRSLIRQPHGRLHPPSHAVQSCYLPLQHPRPARPRRLLSRRRGKQPVHASQRTLGDKRPQTSIARSFTRATRCLMGAILRQTLNVIYNSSRRSRHTVWQLIIKIFI